MSPEQFLAELSARGIKLRAEGAQLRISAPKGALTPELRDELARRKAEMLALLGRGGDAGAQGLSPVPREGNLPLSFSQQGLWLIDRLEGGNATYNLPSAVRLRGPLQVDVLERCLTEIVRRHESLRTVFPMVEGAARQVIAPPTPVHLPVVELRALPESEREAEAERLAAAEAQRPFDLARGPLLRLTLLRLEERSHLLLVTMHHIISDAWSLGLFLRELISLYEAFSAGKPSPLPEQGLHYADFAAWQRQHLEGPVLESQLGYWKQQLAGVPPQLSLMTDRPRPPVQSFRGATHRFQFDAGLARGLKAVGQQAGATLYMVLLGAFSTLLYRLSGQEDIPIGSPFASRKRRETESIIGFFVNTLVMRARMEGDPTFTELLGRVRQVCLDAFAHQDVPFEKVVEALQPARGLSHSPLFQAMFVMHNAPGGPLPMADLTATPLEQESGTSKFDLTLTLEDKEQGLKGSIEYSTDLFDAATISRMEGQLRLLLEGIVANPQERLSRFPLLTPAERHVLVAEWNQTRAEYSREVRMHHLLEAQAERTPDAVALVMDARQLTYRELNTRANQLARYLRGRGVGPEVRVGICLERSPEMMVGLLGILKAGGAYVALDPATPRERLSFMMEDADIQLLLTTEPLLALFPDSHVRAVRVDTDREEIARESGSNLHVPVSEDNLAYVIYTSGSTGRPKGIAMRHQPMSNMIAWTLRTSPFQPGDRTLQFAPLSFDISVQESFCTWATGGTLVLLSEEVRRDAVSLLRLLVDQSIHRLFLPFVVFQQLTEVSRAFGLLPTEMKEVYTAGEQLVISPAVAEFFQKLPGCLLHNHYGPSEAHVISAYTLRGPVSGWPTRPPVGKPLSNTEIYLLDRHMRPVPVGVPGEVYVGGDGLARGYLKRPELTAERFIPDPFSGRPGARLYRTGDLARHLPGGNLEFLGRIDNQVKVRGFRIELEEVEAVLGQHSDVREVVAMVREDKPGDKRLVAYVAPKPERELTVSGLRHFLREKLPEYMVPSIFVILEALPLTLAGKVERRALPVPEATRSAQQADFVPPSTPTEKTLAAIWAEVLGVKQVGLHDNFFELGGHSLLATRVSFRVNEAFQVELPLRGLFEEPTVAGLSRRIETIRWAAQGMRTPASGTPDAERDMGAL
ncbi:amino acid adenylation domain-containing protein [Archangium violaceum]|uniref:non-ribosomal peptide synthetase n=1 Tax=Archangium violaceum TaxID=83451 RepID=UPI00193C7050|nr:non-ribosomal peptide synthetase [Archangium violaceum]QRK08315.1 amino acid adenylation domain-containing protein [Archangium violaceum]